MTPREFVDELAYRNYVYNRTISPTVSVERWERVYGPQTKAMETRYRLGRIVGDLTAMVIETENLTN